MFPNLKIENLLKEPAKKTQLVKACFEERAAASEFQVDQRQPMSSARWPVVSKLAMHAVSNLQPVPQTEFAEDGEAFEWTMPCSMT